MRILFTLIISAVSFANILGQASELKFEVSASSENVFLGDDIVLTYRIYDPDLAHLANSSDFKPYNIEFQKIVNPSAFTYSINMESQDTGLIKIGPFKINYQNQDLVSNELVIRVTNQKENIDLFFDVPTTVSVDSEGLLKIKSNKIDISNITLRNSKYFTITGSSYSTSTKFINNKTDIEYIRVFRVIYTKKGILELTKDDVLNVPGDFKNRN